jgi:arginine decarboxylase
LSTSNSPLPHDIARTFPVLAVAEVVADRAVARAADRIEERLLAKGLKVVRAGSLFDAETAVASDAGFCCVVLSWKLCAEDLEKGLQVIGLVRRRTSGLPILLAMTREDRSAVPLAYVESMDGFIWLPEDSPDFIAGRIEAAARRYLDSILPPFFGALVNFGETHEYSWHTPGHTGGTAFMKSAVGKAFLEFYGEQMLRSDLSVSVGALGSLNDHSGPCRAAEEHAARVFGADLTYFSINGSSASNEIILQSAVTDGDVVLVDRNCHKSLNYALNQSGAIPVYLMPRRNARGLIGPVPQSEISRNSIDRKLAASALVADKSQRPVMAALTNSTYDGLCYDIRATTAALSQTVERIHYDEAWFAYARFNPLYEGRYGMHRGARRKDDATVTVTHSTHKLLAALSQASMIHIRNGRTPVDPVLFNEAFMMHTSTSPQYSIIASTDVSAKMMADAGAYLTDECLVEAIAFRQAMSQLNREIVQRSARDWWFGVWQPDHADGKPFADADPDMLRSSSAAWLLKPNAKWHGFGDLGEEYCMLDPIKVTVLTPGLGSDGKMGKTGIPAPLVSSFLGSRGIVVEKTEPYSILVLFSVGVTKGKWGSLVAGLMEFKRAYDANAPLVQVLPALVDAHPDVYRDMGLKDLAAAMHGAMCETRVLEHMDAAFTQLPDAVLSPHATYSQLVRRKVEKIPVSELPGRIAAVQLVPYPPGIPIMMPGERVTAKKRAVVDYLLALQHFDGRFPGFGHDTHGIEVECDRDGNAIYMTRCLKA